MFTLWAAHTDLVTTFAALAPLLITFRPNL
jgi:hypothetical protein